MMRQRSPFGKHLALVAMASLVMAGCGGGGGGGVVITPGISGAVTNTRGGPGVSGASVTATSSMASATTNSQGGYVIALNPGTYDVLAAAPGMAASKFQSVTVVANKSTTANLIMFPVFDPTKPATAPTIAVSGLTPGQTVMPTQTFTVTVATAANLPVRRIDVRASNLNALAGTTSAISPGEAVDVPSATFTLTSTALANGPAFVDIIAYDLNQNAAELMVPFTVSNMVSGTPPATPTGLFLVAVTTGQSLGLFSTQRAQLFSRLNIKQSPNVLNVSGRSIHIQTAPSNATLFVESSWNNVAGATGYKIYRSPCGGAPYMPVAQVTQTTFPFYDDTDPSLAPGAPVCYQVSAFNAGGESVPTGGVAVIPLRAFNVSLAGPASNATAVGTQPTFTWSFNSAVGFVQGYDIVVTGLNDFTPAWITNNFAIIDATSVTYGAFPTVSISPLQSGKVYQWDIYEAEAQTAYAFNSIAIAVANGFASGSLNGPFTFTTAP